ncbi:glutaredoxin family protein [Laribacter hongkongensis]|nr:glutaredoxin family protein [Laribacter hongkongensis]MCG8991846.1 glutaredoxin family protein [Laribacter hongkongensis]MCG8994273.1 glutaredoxin family protein [Laribacter hongkongensis]MCG8997423.1 glutaredoxin family protein [Laribacter hongkongensis]MCG9000715.1 glutaredoxin family protein [Laribacter hongkongensis]MCG9004356.1 glutaredoxin family protein [Laribacter hongkongensis]
MMAPQFTLYYRDYCSLCHAMRDALKPYVAAGQLALEIVDVDADEALVARFDELVPVLVGPDGHEVCHWHFAPERLAAYLAEIG